MEVNTFIPCKHFNMEGLHLLKEILKQGNYLCRLDLKGAYFFCSIEQTVKKLCTFRMGRFPVQIPLPVFWPRSKPKVVYKINKIVSLHPLQTIYKNNNITQRVSNTRENFGGNNLKQEHCDLPVIESRICYKLKERSFSPNTENRILVDNNRLGGDDSVPASEEGRINIININIGILFSQSDYTYCRIPVGDFKYQDRQFFQGNEKFFKQMDIKQANVSETETGFRISGCGWVWMWMWKCCATSF